MPGLHPCRVRHNQLIRDVAWVSGVLESSLGNPDMQPQWTVSAVGHCPVATWYCAECVLGFKDWYLGCVLKHSQSSYHLGHLHLTYIGMSFLVPATHLPVWLPANASWGQQKMTEVFGCCPSCERPGWNSRLLDSSWPCPGHCEHLGSEPDCLCHSAFPTLCLSDWDRWYRTKKGESSESSGVRCELIQIPCLEAHSVP